MRWDSTPFGEENPEPTGNGMGLYAFWRGESRAYGQWDGTLRLLARRIQILRVYGEGPGQEFRLCFCFVKIHVSSATYTVSSSSQVEENSGQLSNAPKTLVCKVPAAQSYLDGGGAQARQRNYPRCAAACTADTCNAAAPQITESAASCCQARGSPPGHWRSAVCRIFAAACPVALLKSCIRPRLAAHR
jgi:hypothetical protein